MDDNTQAQADRFKDAMGVMVAIIVLVTAVAGWRGAVASNLAGFEDYYALTASLNVEESNTLSNAKAIEHLSAFTGFAANDEMFNQLLSIPRANLSPAQQAALDAQLDQEQRLADTNRNFFPGRYAKQDGTYDVNREVAELLAEAEQHHDLAPQPHLDLAAAHDEKAFDFVKIIIVLSVSLLLFTFAGAFHYERRWLRRLSAGAGSILLAFGLAAMVWVEFFV